MRVDLIIFQKAAHEMAENAVLDFLRQNYDLVMCWDALGVSQVNRHPTLSNKKCLCEMLHTMYWTADMHV